MTADNPYGPSRPQSSALIMLDHLPHLPPGFGTYRSVVSVQNDPVAIDARRFLRFGITRQRQVAFGVLLPLGMGGAAVVSGAPWWVLVTPAPLSIFLAVRAFQARLSLEGNRFVVHRVLSSVSVPLVDVVAVGFAAGAPAMVRPLILLTRDGRKIRVRSVSHSRRFLQLPSDGRTKGERRVDEFLKAADLSLRVEPNVDEQPNREED